MKQRAVTASLLGNELKFSVSRSSGPGGQNVNKVNTKVTLRFDIASSRLLTDEEKATLGQKLAHRLTNEGELVVVAQDSRSQLENKEAAIMKFEQVMAKALERRKRRKPTRPTKGSVQDRIKKKKQHGEKKKWRQRPI